MVCFQMVQFQHAPNEFLYQGYASCVSVCSNIYFLMEILKLFQRLAMRNRT